MDACPPLEDIAAFLDGMLPAKERARITEHLARCESCYEIFAGAAHFEEESSAEDTQRRGVIPFPLRSEQDRAPRRIPRWLPLAASVVLAMGLGWGGWRLFLAPPTMTITALVEPLEKNPDVTGYLYAGDTFRGVEPEEDVVWERPYFMAGVHLVDLRLSVHAGNVEAAESHLRDLGSALNEMPGFGDLVKRCTDEAAALNSDKALEQFAQKLPRLEKEIEQALPEDSSFSFGLWTEAGRLAAAVKSSEFFERRDNRRFLSLVQKNVPVAEEIQEQVLGDLRAIERIWEKGDFSDQALATHFQNIIKRIDEYEEDLSTPE